MEQPVLARHVVITITRTDADICHLQIHITIPVERTALTHAGSCQEETAGRASLDVTLREGSGIRETAAVEHVEGIDVKRLNRQHTVRQSDAIHTLVVVPALEVLGILIDDVEAEAPPVAVEVQLVVAIFTQQLGGVERCTERQAEVADTQAERSLPVGIHLSIEMFALIYPLCLDLRS